MLNDMMKRFSLISLLAGVFLLVAATIGYAANKAIDVPAGMAPEPVKVTAVRVMKSERLLELLDKYGNVVRSYRIALGKNPIGHKEYEGDNRTPEGQYIINARNPKSDYYLSLRISYPNVDDRKMAKRKGVKPGGDIFIHGMPNGKSWMWWKYNTKKDWTNGCIAMTDKDIKEMWELVSDNTPITILP